MVLKSQAQTTVPGDDDDEDEEEETEEEKLTNGLAANLGKLLAHDGSSRTYSASLDVRLSSSLRVDRMVGVAEAPLGSVQAAAQPVTDNYCRLTTIHPQRSVTLFLEQVDSGATGIESGAAGGAGAERYAYMQLVVYHTEARADGLPHETVGR
jgi:hypothetical protein